MEPALGFVLYVNNRPTAFGSSLDLAQKLAERFVCHEPPPRLRIESVTALTPSQIWDYDYAAGLWGAAPDQAGRPSSRAPSRSTRDPLSEESNAGMPGPCVKDAT
ncbi:MAG TPA: hypothetical protein VH183_03775 [Burkholderiaceae bacterium]|jgi:hypothetical protein|nr:hypothetical protein [Burkholderiaceae bacterium]